MVIGSVLLRWTRFGRQVYAVGSNPEAAAILGIPSRLVVFVGVRRVRPAGGRRRRDVGHRVRDDQRHVGDRRDAPGRSRPSSSAASNIFGGSGTVAGAALGALFLGFIANALILVGLSQFWLQAIYGLVILVAVSADAVILRRLQRAASLSRSR